VGNFLRFAGKSTGELEKNHTFFEKTVETFENLWYDIANKTFHHLRGGILIWLK
jgi:hypothetical protein